MLAARTDVHTSSRPLQNALDTPLLTRLRGRTAVFFFVGGFVLFSLSVAPGSRGVRKPQARRQRRESREVASCVR